MTVRRPGVRKCPCGSGRPAAACDERALVMCSTIGCGRRFHQRCNNHRWCEACATDREREHARDRQQRRRDRVRAGRAQQLQLEATS